MCSDVKRKNKGAIEEKKRGGGNLTRTGKNREGSESKIAGGQFAQKRNVRRKAMQRNKADRTRKFHIRVTSSKQ